MRGLFTPITYIRRQVFTEIARIAWEGRDPGDVDDIPYRVINREEARYRGSIFHERAIVAARTRLALGLDREEDGQDRRLSLGMEKALTSSSIIEEPLVNVIPFACEACKDGKHLVTNNCRKCIAHPCMVVCPINAISIEKDRAQINEDKCIDCGKCRSACPYSAIVKQERPCELACGADAIESDDWGRAKINYDKCVSCGMCIVSCPFAAITDKSDIYQLVLSLKRGEKVHGIIAPSFVGQFGPLASPGKIVRALKELGFTELVEVALGADLAAREEAKTFRELVPDKQPFLGTSCCPSWTLTVEKFFPDLAQYVSLSSTPMVETAKEVRKRSPDGKIVFIGPCVAKKIEAMDEEVRPFLDFVITYEELAAIFVAAGVDIADLDEGEVLADASRIGRNFAYASGVAQSIKETIEEKEGREIKTFHAEGVGECRKMLILAQAGKYDGYLLEGMGCPGGCVGGPGTLLQVDKGKREVVKFGQGSPYRSVYQNPKLD